MKTSEEPRSGSMSLDQRINKKDRTPKGFKLMFIRTKILDCPPSPDKSGIGATGWMIISSIKSSFFLSKYFKLEIEKLVAGFAALRMFGCMDCWMVFYQF